MIWAVDFDGTLCENTYPKIGAPKQTVIDFCKRLRRDGHKLILWTCREGARLDEAVAWCNAQGMTFDAVNTNLPEQNELYGNDSRKIGCDFIIDDKNLFLEGVNKVDSIVKGVSPDAEITVNEQGGKQSKSEYAFHLIDPDALLSLAEVMQLGASRYERDNWRKIPSEEHYNHMMVHYFAWLKGDRSDDHLAHMLCRAMMLYATAKTEEQANATD